MTAIWSISYQVAAKIPKDHIQMFASHYWLTPQSSHACFFSEQEEKKIQFYPFIVQCSICAWIREKRTHRPIDTLFPFINNGDISTEKNAEIVRPVRKTNTWKVLPSSGFYMNRNYKGGLKNASCLAVTTLKQHFYHFIRQGLHRNLLKQSSGSVCGFCYQMATFFSYSQKHVAAFCLPHSHPGPHWSASERSLSLLPSSGCHWWRPPWGLPADLHSGSRPRRPRGCPGLWTWCHRR